MQKRGLKTIDLSKLLLPYENKWIALSLNYKQVLGAGKTLAEAKKRADQKNKKYRFLKVPPFNVSYVPAS